MCECRACLGRRQVLVKALVVGATFVAMAAARAAPATSAAPAASEPVLAESAVTTEALLEALDTPRTRQWKPGQRPVQSRASLLITFVSGSAELTDSAKRTLETLAQALKHPRLTSSRFVIEGHADRRGLADANLRLSAGRARSVRDYLVQSQGVDAARLAAVGKGDRQPLNRGVIDAPENRRVTVVAQPQPR